MPSSNPRSRREPLIGPLPTTQAEMTMLLNGFPMRRIL